MRTSCIVIPCFNEEKRLPLQAFKDFLSDKENENIYLCFVNDGSSDNTLEILTQLSNLFPERILIVDEKQNAGKAASVFTGINQSIRWKNFNIIGYLDADLATPLDEYVRVSSYINDDIVFVFGSRIRRIGSNINRKLYRHLIGRFFATLASIILDLPVYDTQCGAKIFTKDIALQVFKTPFISTWSFDVEIFFRFINIVGKENVEIRSKEIPLETWNDVGESKVKFTYALKLPFELLRIRNHYKKAFKS